MVASDVAVMHFLPTARPQHRWCFFLMLSGGLLLCLSATFAQGLLLDSQRGSVGETVAFTVQIDRAPNSIQALGFSVHYDSQVLRYTGVHAAGDLTRGFEHFAANAPTPGQIRVGGFTTGQAVAAGSSGSLVTLEFRVLQPRDAALSLTQAVDNIATWPVQAGHFTNITLSAPNQKDNVGLPPATADPGPSTSSPSNLSAMPLPAAPVQRTAEPSPAVPQGSVNPQPVGPRSTPDNTAPENTALPQVPTAQDKGVTRQPDPAGRTSTAKLSPSPTPAPEMSPSQRPSQSDSVTTHDRLQQLAQEGSTALRSPRESTGPPPIQTKGGPDAPSEPLFQNFRVAVPLVALVLLGVIIVALVSMHSPD